MNDKEKERLVIAMTMGYIEGITSFMALISELKFGAIALLLSDPGAQVFTVMEMIREEVLKDPDKVMAKIMEVDNTSSPFDSDITPEQVRKIFETFGGVEC